MKKRIKVGLAFILVFVLSIGLVGALGASGKLQTIQAHFNSTMTFVKDGKSWYPKDSHGKNLTPIMYKGSTYVPLRAAFESAGYSVKFDGKTQKVELTSPKNTGYFETGDNRIKFDTNTISIEKGNKHTTGIVTDKGELCFASKKLRMLQRKVENFASPDFDLR